MSASDQIIDKFLNAIWLEFGLSKNTLLSYGSDLRQFDKWLKSKTLSDVCEEDISAFLLFRQNRVQPTGLPLECCRVCGVSSGICYGKTRLAATLPD